MDWHWHQKPGCSIIWFECYSCRRGFVFTKPKSAVQISQEGVLTFTFPGRKLKPFRQMSLSSFSLLSAASGRVSCLKELEWSQDIFYPKLGLYSIMKSTKLSETCDTYIRFRSTEHTLHDWMNVTSTWKRFIFIFSHPLVITCPVITPNTDSFSGTPLPYPLLPSPVTEH